MLAVFISVVCFKQKLVASECRMKWRKQLSCLQAFGVIMEAEPRLEVAEIAAVELL